MTRSAVEKLFESEVKTRISGMVTRYSLQSVGSLV